MSKRLQVLLGEREYSELGQIADRHGVTVSEWVRQAIRSARRREATGDPERKLAALRLSAQHAFPAPDIDQMLSEIRQGYLTGLE
ncbi:MAG: antitoxin [Solirubrobacteraceae bacterium]